MNTRIRATSRCTGAAVAALLLTTGAAFARAPQSILISA